MILRGWEIEGFGIFRGMSLSELPEGLTLLLGPNEAGKSTLLGFLRFLLFGFGRGSQQKYPPLQGGRHGGRLTFEDGEGRWTIERIQGQTVRLWAPDGSQLGEDALRQRLGGIDAEIFRSIFAFSLFELANLETLDQDEVRDRLYSAGITGAGRSAQSVLAQLRKGTEVFLRPRSKEGVVNKLSDALVQARRELGQAQGLAGRFGEIERQLTAAEVGAQELEAQADGIERRLHHLARLESLYVPWNRLQRMTREIALQTAPQEVPRELEERIETARTSLGEARAAAERQEEGCRTLESRLGHEAALLDPGLIEAAQPLQSLLQDSALQRDRLGRLTELEREIAVQERSCADAATAMGTSAAAQLPGVGQDELREADDRLARLQDLIGARARREADEEAAQARGLEAEALHAAAAAEAESYAGVLDLEAYHLREAALERQKEAAERLARRQGQLYLPGMVALGLLAVGAGAAVEQMWPLAVLAPLGLLALLVVAFGPPGREARRAARDVRTSAQALGLERPLAAEAAAEALAQLRGEFGRVGSAATARDRLKDERDKLNLARRQLEESQARLRSASAAVDEALAGLAEFKAALGVPAGLMPQHLPSHLRGVQALQAARTQISGLTARRDAELGEIGAWQARAGEILARIGSDSPQRPEALLEAVAALRQPLADALAHDTARRLLQTDLGEARRRFEELRGQEQTALQELTATLAQAEIPDMAAFDAWRQDKAVYDQRLHDRDLADAALRDQAGREGDAIALELAEGSPEAWQSERDQISRRLQEIRAERDDALRKGQDLRRQRSEIAESADVPSLAARCAELEEELGRAGEAWRAQALAQRLLERTLDIYVASRQPDVLRIASDALQRITSGRYQEVRQRVDGQGLLATAPGGATKEPGELSRGTQEQLYLALRLGLAASYGERVAALPLVLDDVAVNFDPGRQAALLHVLARFTAEPGRQALFFTCHPSLVQLAREAAPGLRVIDLATGEEARSQAAAASDETTEDTVLRLLAPGPLALRELAQQSGAEERELREIVRSLAAQGRVEAVGSGRGRRYALA